MCLVRGTIPLDMIEQLIRRPVKVHSFLTPTVRLHDESESTVFRGSTWTQAAHLEVAQEITLRRVLRHAFVRLLSAA